MRILLAKHAGFCFGVQRAVKKALELAREGKQLVSLGDLIHNQRFVDYLRGKGHSSVERVEDVPKGACVLIRSHGVPPVLYQKLKDRGLQYVDLTCPLWRASIKKSAKSSGTMRAS